MPDKVDKNFKIVLSSFNQHLDLLEGVEFVRSPKCGAINTFLGTIRDTDSKSFGINCSDSCSKPIEAIYYEAYESMAIKQISDIVEETINSPKLESNDNNSSRYVDPNSRAYVAIRLGRVAVQETSIIICVSSTSRGCSHKATMLILERIKSLAPIWKKIIFLDGHEEWADTTKSEAIWLR